MKVAKEMPEVPCPPSEPRHDCGDEIRGGEAKVGTYRRFGMVVECSCGKRYELRPINFARFLVGELFGSVDSTYSATQYWARIRGGAR